MFTINQAREGKVAIKNDGTKEELITVTGDKETLGNYPFYYQVHGCGRWCVSCEAPSHLPIQSVKDFLTTEEPAWEPKWGEEVEVGDAVGQWHKKYKYVGKHPTMAGHVVVNLIGDVVTCYVIIRPLQSVTLTLQQIADKFDIAVEKLKIVE